MIFKFQQGGAMPPLVSYTPVIIQDRRTLGDGETTTTSSTSDKGEGHRGRQTIELPSVC